MFSPDRYVDALRFAAAAHLGQREPPESADEPELPYLVHVVSVAAEVIAALPHHPGIDADLAVTCAVLHDTVEDTRVTLDEVRTRYGDRVAAGVAALSKDPAITDKDAAMADSLRRINEQPREIAIVKLCDRIINMKQPPHYWPKDKRAKYSAQATLIADTLGHASAHLAARLRARVEAYAKYC